MIGVTFVVFLEYVALPTPGTDRSILNLLDIKCLLGPLRGLIGVQNNIWSKEWYISIISKLYRYSSNRVELILYGDPLKLYFFNLYDRKIYVANIMTTEHLNMCLKGRYGA